jgi:hypothetical protein
MFTGEVYLLSAPVAESMPQPTTPPRTIFPKVAPAVPDLFMKVLSAYPSLLHLTVMSCFVLLTNADPGVGLTRAMFVPFRSSPQSAPA